LKNSEQTVNTEEAKGKQLGRPKKLLDTKRIAMLRAQGVGWKRIAAETGVGVGTIYRVAQEGSKIREKVF
jgi:DNA invertase Pin-like site-specific DNA recombinase